MEKQNKPYRAKPVYTRMTEAIIPLKDRWRYQAVYRAEDVERERAEHKKELREQFLKGQADRRFNNGEWEKTAREAEKKLAEYEQAFKPKLLPGGTWCYLCGKELCRDLRHFDAHFIQKELKKAEARVIALQRWRDTYTDKRGTDRIEFLERSLKENEELKTKMQGLESRNAWLEGFKAEAEKGAELLKKEVQALEAENAIYQTNHSGCRPCREAITRLKKK